MDIREKIKENQVVQTILQIKKTMTNYLTNAFILGLKSQIKETLELWDDGSVNEYSTNRARFKVLIAAEPGTAEDIVAYVMFLESLNAIQNKEVREKLNRIIQLSSISVPKEQLQVAIDLLAKYERPKGLFNRLFNDHTRKFKKDYNPFRNLPIDLKW